MAASALLRSLAAYMYYKAGLAGQWPFLRVFSAIGRRMAQQRWPMAEDPRLFTDFTLALEPLVAGSSLRTREKYIVKNYYDSRCFVVCNELCNRFVMITSHYKGW